MATENKELIRAFFTGLNERDLSSAVSAISPEFIHHSTGARGHDGMRAFGEMFLGGFPDMHITIDDVIGEGDRVVTRGRWTGTHQGDFMGIPATGRSVDVEYIDLWRVEDGLLAENWVQMDIMGMMQQLGVVPDPSAAVV